MARNHSASILTDDQPTKVPRMWGPISTIILTVLLFFASQLAVAVVIVLCLAFLHSSAAVESSILAQFLAISAAEGALIAGVYFFLKLRKLSLRSIGLANPNLGDLGYAVAGFIVYLLSYVVVTAVVKVVLPQVNLEQQQEIGFQGARGLSLVPVFICLVVLPPLAEEIVFRGFLYSGLKSKWPKWVAALITSGLFAVAHLQAGNGAPLLWVAAIDTFLLSLMLIYLREKRGSLAAPMLLHTVKNGLAFLVLFIFMLH